MKLLSVLFAALLLAGCATPRTEQAATPRSGADKKLGDAVVAPLADLNLVRDPIPPILAAAQQAPYGTPADGSCSALGAEIAALDAALGADLDTARDTEAATLAERGADAAGDAMISAVRSTTEGVIPFRGWVRKLTGAERYAKEVAASIAAGTVRRAYLKGLGQAAGCVAPAAPKPGREAKAAAGAPGENIGH
ncbi:hypothetical protein [Ramlibacter sp. AN1133]|uniref:hypothetical protein n=1 Tax=Ramlibacter sp. AN1133 TaxID=3133429 RepID=UPI0030BF1CA2